MRLLVVLGCLLLAACAGPHTTGALWAQQNLDRELQLFHLSDAQRADQARAFERGLADETLAAERARIEAELRDCPGDTRQPLAVSVGDRPRDTIRLQAQGDASRLAVVGALALADWRVRRAREAGEARFCDHAREALAGSSAQPPSSDVLSKLGSATVIRDPLHPGTAASSAAAAAPVISATAAAATSPAPNAARATPAPATDPGPPSLALSYYALGYVDTVRAPSPLPQYLAAVYGGVVTGAPGSPPLAGGSPEAQVDRLAPAYPEWEPDALYAAFSTP